MSRTPSTDIDMETLGFYGVRDGKFARAQMFCFDTTAVLRFPSNPAKGCLIGIVPMPDGFHAG